MQSVTQSEMDALAAMANATLLPAVNAMLASNPPGWDLDGHLTNVYRKYVGSAANPGFIASVYPQPPYSFVRPTATPNLVPSGAVYDGSGNYALTVPAAGDYNLTLGNATALTIPSSGEYYGAGGNNLYFTAGLAVTFQGTSGQPVTATLALSADNWLYELNRIRGDAMDLLMNSYAGVPSGFYQNPAAVSSGPWVVGINDPDTWPLLGRAFNDYLYYQNIYYENLSGSLVLTSTNELICFSSVRFYFATAGGSPVIETGRYSEFGDGLPGTAKTLSYVATTAGTWTVNFVWHFRWDGGGTPPSAPPPSAFSPSVSGATITWSTEPDAFNNSASRPADLGGYPVGNNYYLLIGSFALSLTAGSGAVAISLTPPSNYTMLTMEGYYFMAYSSESTQLSDNGLHPTAPVKYIAADAHPSNSNFTVNGVLGAANWRETTGIKGIWVAKTLPVPGNNVFIDQDMPPYVGALHECSTYKSVSSDAGVVAIAGNGQCLGSTESPLASTMRQLAPPSLTNGVNPVLPGITTRPAKWLVRRDTDFVPFDFGFNNKDFPAYYSNQTVAAGVLLNGFTVDTGPAGASLTAVKIRLVQAGTGVPGWKNIAGTGTFQYGEPLGTNLTILVRKAGEPTLSLYDFETTNNAVTIPTDGGGGYLATITNGGFLFAVYNPTGAAVAFDCYVELDVGTPTRLYFPPPGTGECFSYCLDGTPGKNPQLMVGMEFYTDEVVSKPVPQMGYSIFCLRATLLPVLNASGISAVPMSGPALTITIGQNIFNAGANTLTFTPLKLADGTTNLTVTIPATARDSDDVPVFIPVLGGNELVWQCDSQVMLEAWANWQPIFFNTMFGTGQAPFDTSYPINQPLPTAFQYALAFLNQTDVSRFGWTYPRGTYYNDASAPIPAAVVYPLFRQLYDDLVSTLTAFGGTLPTGTQASGAGGTGSAGGAGSAGDPASGGGSPMI